MAGRFFTAYIQIILFITIAFVEGYSQTISPFETEIQQFDFQDSTNLYPQGSILFTGSSSIRLWKTLKEDLSPFPVINRGFGGSKMTDVLFYKERIFKKRQYSAVVIFVANDIVGATDGSDKSPEQVAGLFSEFVNVVRQKQGAVPVFIMAITPTPSRWKVWPEIKKVNHLLAQLADGKENVLFIPTEDLFLGEDGLPSKELFVSDQLHLSAKGYSLWTKRLRSYLDPVMSHK